MRGMNRQRSYFIISPNVIDLLTLGSLLLATAGLLLATKGALTLAIAVMLLAMLADMLDGALARRLKLESDFGRYLDSFCDVFTYLLLPLLILYQFGMQDVLSLAALFGFLVSGILRLSRFNVIGTVEEAGIQYHLGLQVIWSHLLVVLAFPAWRWLGPVMRYPLMALLLVMSFFMIRNLRFRKPTSYGALSVLILSVSGLYFYLDRIGIRLP
jgi:CDP-diacylglycerol--serine O-phosphatidyltransferase